ncbi:uroporphyrinogen-III synthase [Psychrobium sp. nBUS_13]|uniref:uroporphyrinogen-III synthase n=1 Tax=Psychrobium sp. nBUS_13 TaxID=3395319 RepID=UPI003EBD47ED
MHKLSPNDRRVLITRPQAKSAHLQTLLLSHQLYCLSYPLVQFSAKIAPLAQQSLLEADIIIAVSENAVIFANQQINDWPESAQYYAVGKATQQQFSLLEISADSPEHATSEGLLALSHLANVQNKHVVILRGDGGREYLAQELDRRGARVEYVETYCRELVPVSHSDQVLQWQQEQINTIVVTSGEILQYLWDNIGEINRCWLKRLSLIVPSQRIVTIAENLGFQAIELSNGADNESILKILLNEC